MAVLDLCRAWDEARQPPGKAVPSETRRALAAAAGGVPEIDDFCDDRLGRPSAPAEPTGSPQISVTPKATGPGKPTKTHKPRPTPSQPEKKTKGNGP